MARKTVRRNGRNITIDTNTGKEIKPGTAAWRAAGRLVTNVRNLPRDMLSVAKNAGRDVRDNVIYSDKPDKKGRPQTIAQERVRKQTANKNRKEGQTATLNGKPVVWKGGKWVSKPKLPTIANTKTIKKSRDYQAEAKAKGTSTTKTNTTSKTTTPPKKDRGKRDYGSKEKNLSAWAKANAKLAKRLEEKKKAKAKRRAGGTLYSGRTGNSSIA